MTGPADSTTGPAESTTSTTADTDATDTGSTGTDDGDTGPEPYGDCANLPRRLCGDDEECVTTLGTVAYGVCAVQDCVDDGECPSGPSGSTAAPTCADVDGDGVAECVLACGATRACPTTMSCVTGYCSHPEVSLRCADETLGAMLPLFASGTNAGRDDDHAPACGGPKISPDVAFQFTAPFSALYEMHTFGSAFDTILSVRTACRGDTLACNDDAMGLASQLFVELAAGQTVLVIVDGHQQAGDFDLFIDITAGDGDCCTANRAVAGCEVPMIETCVCGMDSFCCDTEWDDVCVALAQDECGALCP